MPAPPQPRPPFAIQTSLLLACCLLISPTGIRAEVALPDSAGIVRWDLRTGAVSYGELTGGDLLTVKIRGMNPRCWSYEITVETTEMGDDLGAVIDALEVEVGEDREEAPTEQAPQLVGEVDPLHAWRAAVAELQGKAAEVRTSLCASDATPDAPGLGGALREAANRRREFTQPDGSEVTRDSMTALFSRHAQAELLARRLLALSRGSTAGSELTVPTSRRTTKVRMEVKATRRDDLGLQPKERIVEATLHLQPAYRIVVGAGWMGSWLNQKSYERTELPVNNGDGNGNTETRLSFVDRDDSSELAHSPMIQLGVFFWRWDWLSSWVGVSTGVATRTVNKIPAPEPFLGGSLLVGDVLMLSFGGHLGRVENLAGGLESFEGDLPASVQTRDVVGSAWCLAYALTASIKLR